MLVVLLLLNKTKEGKYIGAATGEPYAIAEYIGDVKGETPYFDKINMMCKIYPEKFTEKPIKDEKKSSQNQESERVEQEENTENTENKTEDTEKEE
jgi:hypothetical protein